MLKDLKMKVEEIEYEDITNSSSEDIPVNPKLKKHTIPNIAKVMSVTPACCQGMHSMRRYESQEVRNIGRLSYGEGHYDGVMDLAKEITKMGWGWIVDKAITNLNESILRHQSLEDE